jgi:hypothetical protein
MNIEVEEPEHRKVRSNGQPYNYTTHNTHIRHSGTPQTANDKKNYHVRS